MIKREQQFTLQFRHWIKANPQPLCCAFELKQTTADSIPFSAVQEHQLDALIASASEKGLLWKLPDDSRGIKPFDMFYLTRADGYVVIKYPDFFCLIGVYEFIKEKALSKRKSLTADRAREIAYIVI